MRLPGAESRQGGRKDFLPVSKKSGQDFVQPRRSGSTTRVMKGCVQTNAFPIIRIVFCRMPFRRQIEHSRNGRFSRRNAVEMPTRFACAKSRPQNSSNTMKTSSLSAATSRRCPHPRPIGWGCGSSGLGCDHAAVPACSQQGRVCYRATPKFRDRPSRSLSPAV